MIQLTEKDDPLDGTGSLDLSMEDLELFIADYREV